jgi:hypothetical protein
MISGDGPAAKPEQGEGGEWVQAEEAIKREAELLARIQELEKLSERGVELISRAAAMLSARQLVLSDSGYALDAIGARGDANLERGGGEVDHDYRVRLIAKLREAI